MSNHSQPVPGSPSRRLIAGIVLALVVAAVVWIFRAELKSVAGGGIETIRAAGPVPYFVAMALLPLPLAWFTVPAGELFAGQLTVPGVIAACMVAVLVQLSLSYVVARYALRPMVERLLHGRGYKVPQVTPANAVSVVMLVRVLPGPPMILGSCLLALARTPFAIYLLLSALVALPWVCAGVIFGQGLLSGRFAPAAAGAGLLIVLVIAVRLFRRRWKSRGEATLISRD
ncbi:VTT domain-containing protein [Rariglobus hedericola]|uniref:VTT domain-containing protein n=1 Tax=Rariglobus hedericola TaxID=2597822 RepID=A0A556QQV2_9BACT|nr:VTT domain-containing protein [Rariglobus hedericola]TSJ79017.1 VTT domain-containing protein [Rariglobus hedericola]